MKTNLLTYLVQISICLQFLGLYVSAAAAETISTSTYKPCSAMQAEPEYQNVIKTPLSNWQANNQNIRKTALVIIGNATNQIYSQLPDEALLGISKMDCGKFRTHPNYTYVTEKSWKDYARSAAIDMLSESAHISKEQLSVLTNERLRALIIGTENPAPLKSCQVIYEDCQKNGCSVFKRGNIDGGLSEIINMDNYGYCLRNSCHGTVRIGGDGSRHQFCTGNLPCIPGVRTATCSGR